MRNDFFKDYGFKISLVVVFLLAFIWMGTKQTIESNSNAVEDWLPAQHKETRDYRWYLQQFPFESYVVIGWEGCEIDDDRIELFAQKLCPEQTIDNYSLSSSVESAPGRKDRDKVLAAVAAARAIDGDPDFLGTGRNATRVAGT